MKILFSKNSKKQIRKLPTRTQQKIFYTLEKFEKNRQIDIIKMRGKKDEFRIRTGNYKIQLSKIKEGFLITKIGKRENFYLIFL